jgi:hypothetical protein
LKASAYVSTSPDAQRQPPGIKKLMDSKPSPSCPSSFSVEVAARLSM